MGGAGEFKSAGLLMKLTVLRCVAGHDLIYKFKKKIWGKQNRGYVFHCKIFSWTLHPELTPQTG